jgi:ferredoxin
MIVAERKPLDAVVEMLKGDRKVLAVGCGTCVAVCMAGGKKEVGMLASALRMATGLEGEKLEVDETLVQRQCETEYIESLDEKVGDYDAIVSLGCGVGVQYLADRFPEKRIVPALDTKFMGGPTEAGVWEERCQGCGSCMLGTTGGVCPIDLGTHGQAGAGGGAAGAPAAQGLVNEPRRGTAARRSRRRAEARSRRRELKADRKWRCSKRSTRAERAAARSRAGAIWSACWRRATSR